MNLSRTPLGRWVAALQPITIFLCGDVMTGRGIDQVLPHPGDPRLQETLVKDAGRYVELAERVHGPIPRPVDFTYVWGDALDQLDRVGADVRIINLETAVTTSSAAWGGKGVHYRMHPDNIGCIRAAEIEDRRCRRRSGRGGGAGHHGGARQGTRRRALARRGEQRGSKGVGRGRGAAGGRPAARAGRRGREPDRRACRASRG
jgi:hypothetical protein